MAFLVSIDVRTPPGMDPDRLAALQADEAARSRELVAQGLLKRIWRIPGRRANASLYEGADADAVHRALMSLPLYPWLDVQGQALATHPVEVATPAP